LFIPDPNPGFLPIPNTGSRGQGTGSGSATLISTGNTDEIPIQIQSSDPQKKKILNVFFLSERLYGTTFMEAEEEFLLLLLISEVRNRGEKVHPGNMDEGKGSRALVRIYNLKISITWTFS
jgi:hypothetical protein